MIDRGFTFVGSLVGNAISVRCNLAVIFSLVSEPVTIKIACLGKKNWTIGANTIAASMISTAPEEEEYRLLTSLQSSRVSSCAP